LTAFDWSAMTKAMSSRLATELVLERARDAAAFADFCAPMTRRDAT